MLKWRIDGSYEVHTNIGGHSGDGIFMGIVLPISYLKKHKLNTQRSTESEIIGVDDFMP